MSLPKPSGPLSDHHKSGRVSKDGGMAQSYRCGARGCHAYDPTGGGYWPIVGGSWLCREHLEAAIRKGK